ncbi:MAG: PPC domain-containing DNA-binding protein [Promethearchaeota archaeon]
MNSIESTIGKVIVGKILPDEDIIDAIKEMVIEHDFKSGLVNAIGALKKTTIGYFNIETKEYEFKTIEEDVELVSCMGNVSFNQEVPIIHLHVVLGKKDYGLFGGHLSQPSIVSVTGEVFIYKINDKLMRSEDSRFGLSLLNI